MNLNMRNGRAIIDGREFVGSCVSISDGNVVVDGVVQDGTLSGVVNIEVHGDVERLENNNGKVVANNVGSITTQSGDVECGDVSGAVKTMSGDVNCSSVGISISTMSGDVTHR